jgi:hypothetical protein
MDWLMSLAFAGMGFLSFELGKRSGRKEHKLPYTWTCLETGCRVHFESSDWNVLMRVTDEHMRKSHGSIEYG